MSCHRAGGRSKESPPHRPCCGKAQALFCLPVRLDPIFLGLKAAWHSQAVPGISDVPVADSIDASYFRKAAVAVEVGACFSTQDLCA